MPAVWMNPGERAVLKLALTDTEPPWYCKLFGNDHVPTFDDAEDGSDYEEVSFSGYESVLIENWTEPTTISGVAYVTADDCEFVADSGASGTALAYGYYVMDADVDGLLILAERFTAPVNFNAEGVSRKVSITATLRALASP